MIILIEAIQLLIEYVNLKTYWIGSGQRKTKHAIKIYTIISHDSFSFIYK